MPKEKERVLHQTHKPEKSKLVILTLYAEDFIFFSFFENCFLSKNKDFGIDCYVILFQHEQKINY